MTSAQKSQDAFVQLLTEQQARVFGFIFAIVHNVPDAEDVFQQTCIVLWEKFDNFEPGTDFGAWACTIAKHKAMHFLAKHKRSAERFADIVIDQLAARQPARGDQSQDRMRALAKCKEQLCEKDRQLLALCYDRGSAIRDIAKQIERPIGSVYDSLWRIRRRLFDCIQARLTREGAI